MRKISTGWWVVIIIYVCSLICTIITHSMMISRYSTNNVIVTCTDKRREPSTYYNKYKRVYLDFTVNNVGVCDAREIKGVVTIVNKLDNTILLEEEYIIKHYTNAESTSNVDACFYDDDERVKNFEALYEADFSELDVVFEMESVDFTEGNSSFSIFKTMVSIPTYIIICLLFSFIVIYGSALVFLGSKKINNQALKIIYIIVLLPIWFFGYILLTCKGGKKRKGIWVFIPEEFF